LKTIRIAKTIKPQKGIYLGERYKIEDKHFGESRCRICGRWFRWQGKVEPPHCGKSTCRDYYDYMLIAQDLRQKERESKYQKMFFTLLKKGLVK